MTSPVKAGHQEYSMIYSSEDDCSQPSDRLIRLSIEVIKTAHETSLKKLEERLNTEVYHPPINLWPGEHYRLLAGFVQILKPKIVIEIGTSTGLSALALRTYLAPEASLVTFDVIPWNQVPGTLLREGDFKDGVLKQYTDDLSQWNEYVKHISLMEQADIIFVDAKKDGKMEKDFIDHFKATNFRNKPLIIFDDIKNWMMLGIWRSIEQPKLDITSFGHFTGTGIVDWE
jgi:predicted O-methyltransferase YrrM